MRDASDMELLREYARQNLETAFAELVRRHVNLVYSAALRHVGIAAQAEEITQAVFVILARKAANLREGLILEAWLFETTRLTALSFLRGERRRQFREQEAYMQSILHESTPDAVWQQLAPLLDEAMMRLGRREREAVVLRFFKGQSLREVATVLNINEPAAQKRVNRALEKLRRCFCKRGVDSTAAAIAEDISLHSVQVAPVALVKTVTAVALAKGATASISTLTLIKGALNIMAWTKAKTAIVTGVVVLFTAGTTTVVVERIAHANSLKQRLPDGSVLSLDKVSLGDRLAVQFGITGKNATNNPLVKPAFFRQFRCIIRGETGIDFVEEFSPAPGIKKLSGGKINTKPQTSISVQTSIFPRDSKWLWFRVEKSETNNPYGPWQTVAEFKVANPARAANNPWAASPTPITNNVDGMEFVLDEVMVETRPFSPRDIWNHVVTLPMKVYEHDVLLTNWGAVYGQMADASGNWSPNLQRHRSLDPGFVWKLEMDFEPQSNFTAENVATVNLPRPRSKITTEVMGQPVTISWDGTWIDADMPTNRPDLALKFVGAADAQGNEMLKPAGSWDQYRFREGDFIVRREGILTTVDVRPAKVTLAVVPNIHTTFYIQPRLVAENVK
jgi:RNA polymerase sigma factor (sigma-70 family)